MSSSDNFYDVIPGYAPRMRASCEGSEIRQQDLARTRPVSAPSNMAIMKAMTNPPRK